MIAYLNGGEPGTPVGLPPTWQTNERAVTVWRSPIVGFLKCEHYRDGLWWWEVREDDGYGFAKEPITRGLEAIPLSEATTMAEQAYCNCHVRKQ